MGSAGSVLVTGALGLIGAAVVNELLVSGYTPIGVDVREAASGSSANDYRRGDARDASFIRRVLSDCNEGSQNQLAGVIHAAGLNNAVETTISEAAGALASYWEANVVASYVVLTTAVEFLTDNEVSANIVCLTSMYGSVTPDPNLYSGLDPEVSDKDLGYSVSKAAVEAMIRYIGVRTASRGIAILGLAPGGIANGQQADFTSRYESRTPSGKMQSREEVAKVAVSLLEQRWRASTGRTIHLDGGYSLI